MPIPMLSPFFDPPVVSVSSCFLMGMNNRRASAQPGSPMMSDGHWKGVDLRSASSGVSCH